MPNLFRRLPKYRKHRASGQAVVTLGGRDYYLGPHGSKTSRQEYDRLCGEYLASGRLAPDSAAEAVTMVELLAGFWEHAREHYGPQNRETANYSKLIKRLKPQYGRTLANEFGPLRMKAFRQSLVDEGLSRTTVNHAINRLRRIFKWGVENELVRPDVLEALKAVAGLRYGKAGARETEPVRPVQDEVVDATIKHCSPQLAAMIELQRVTGMRSGEVCRMRSGEIDMSGETWTYTPARHKTQYRGHTRIVYLGPKAQAILKNWLRTDLTAFLFQPLEAEQWRRQQRHSRRKTPLSCGNRPGSNRKRKPRKAPRTCYEPQSYGRAITYAIGRCNKARQEAGRPEIPHWHPHQLRHNFATMARRECGLEAARLLLGHKHASITELYAEADQHLAIQVAGKLS